MCKVCYYADLFFISSWFKAIVTAYWKHLLSFLLLGSIVAFLFFIQLCCFFVFYPIRKIYIWSTTIRILSLTMVSMLPLFEFITRSSSLSMEEIKLLAIVDWIFHVLDFLRLFISFKDGLILLRYSSIYSVLLLSLLLSFSI